MSSPLAHSLPSPPHAGTRSLAEQGCERLRLAIVQCRLSPGERLTEASVAKQLRVGKMPAREALRRLVADGYVQVMPRSGYAVAPITLRRVRELFELRLIVEPAAVEQAVGRVRAADHLLLRKLGDVGYRVDSRASVKKYLRANTEFHTRLARLSGNRRLGELVAALLLECERLINFVLPAHPRSDSTVGQHRQLCEAVVNGPAEQARAIAHAHICATRDMVVEQILSHTRVEDVPIGL